MSEYKHGAFSEHQITGAKQASEGRTAFVYIGTAPVHTVSGGAANVNKPVLVRSIAEARRLFGYSEDWSKYSLCEAMYVHLEHKGVGPLVLINVLDPAVHKATDGGSVSLTPAKGRMTIVNAGDIVLDSVKVTGKDAGKDYSIAYNHKQQTIVISEAAAGSLGSEALTITYDSVDAAAVDAADVIGETDGMGLNTGIYAVRNVEQLTGYIPAYMMAPGFSSQVEVHDALSECSAKIGAHWDAMIYTDLPLTNGEGEWITLKAAKTWKQENGYDGSNEKAFYPMGLGKDNRKYHLSVLAAANCMELLEENDGIPYMSASNTRCDLLQGLWMGEENKNRIFDDALLSSELNQHGITTAAYVGGQWVIWGAHTAAYSHEKGLDDEQNAVAMHDTNIAMQYWYGNDFQLRHAGDVDAPMSINDLQSIVAEENARLEALLKIGALTLGEVYLDLDDMDVDDVIEGKFRFVSHLTATPLGRELTIETVLTREGYQTYYDSLTGAGAAEE